MQIYIIYIYIYILRMIIIIIIIIIIAVIRYITRIRKSILCFSFSGGGVLEQLVVI